MGPAEKMQSILYVSFELSIQGPRLRGKVLERLEKRSSRLL